MLVQKSIGLFSYDYDMGDLEDSKVVMQAKIC